MLPSMRNQYREVPQELAATHLGVSRKSMGRCNAAGIWSVPLAYAQEAEGFEAALCRVIGRGDLMTGKTERAAYREALEAGSIAPRATSARLGSRGSCGS